MNVKLPVVASQEGDVIILEPSDEEPADDTDGMYELESEDDYQPNGYLIGDFVVNDSDADADAHDEDEEEEEKLYYDQADMRMIWLEISLTMMRMTRRTKQIMMIKMRTSMASVTIWLEILFSSVEIESEKEHNKTW
ncbi:hypothetical protein BP5796_05373 [Coleophoma crateriformis]|uniref:Uncharacterized protein n=1 Tax=Coleophoma crateriformis TaxID=565419 RepID=A0A3D8S322_9HELO|nr:hypothetical protein BP5796_05373 [Coleophoma crateriformis]